MTIDILHQAPTGNETTEIAMTTAVIATSVVAAVGTIGKRGTIETKKEDTTTAGRQTTGSPQAPPLAAKTTVAPAPLSEKNYKKQ